MENRDAASIFYRTNDGAPATSVPLEVSAYILSFFLLRSTSRAQMLMFLSLPLCLLRISPQGFLKNERDNALLSTIEESRRRVSVCPRVSDCLSGLK